ncbi:MAG: hypothetical protein GEU98_20585 [Pseudonocardiaceae bacterium]|nr:hypothetical protein [Pseudonocardiaceae bacterium]
MGNQPLDATKYGDPGECRTVGESWLKKTAFEAFDNAQKDVKSAVANSRNYWEGDAATTFRNSLKDPFFALESCATGAKSIGQALVTFSQKLDDDVFALLDDACEIAKEGGLSISAEADAEGRDHRIIAPPMAYPSAPGGEAPDAALAEYNDNVKKYTKQHSAYARARSKIKGARQAEENAHRDLRQALSDTGDALSEVIGKLAALIKAKDKISGTSETLLMAADELASTAAITEKVVQGEKLTSAEARTVAMWTKLGEAYDEKGIATDPRVQAVRKFSDKVQDHAATAHLRSLQRTLKFDVTVGQAADKLAGKTAPQLVEFRIKDPTLLKKIRGIPLIGTTYQLGSATNDVLRKNKDIEKVVIEQGLDAGAGAGSGALASKAVKIVKFGNVYVAVGTTIAMDVVIPRVKDGIDDRVLDREFKEYVDYDEKK